MNRGQRNSAYAILHSGRSHLFCLRSDVSCSSPRPCCSFIVCRQLLSVLRAVLSFPLAEVVNLEMATHLAVKSLFVHSFIWCYRDNHTYGREAAPRLAISLSIRSRLCSSSREETSLKTESICSSVLPAVSGTTRNVHTKLRRQNAAKKTYAP